MSSWVPGRRDCTTKSSRRFRQSWQLSSLSRLWLTLRPRWGKVFWTSFRILASSGVGNDDVYSICYIYLETISLLCTETTDVYILETTFLCVFLGTILPGLFSTRSRSWDFQRSTSQGAARLRKGLAISSGNTLPFRSWSRTTWSRRWRGWNGSSGLSLVS